MLTSPPTSPSDLWHFFFCLYKLYDFKIWLSGILIPKWYYFKIAIYLLQKLVLSNFLPIWSYREMRRWSLFLRVINCYLFYHLPYYSSLQCFKESMCVRYGSAPFSYFKKNYLSTGSWNQVQTKRLLNNIKIWYIITVGVRIMFDKVMEI